MERKSYADEMREQFVCNLKKNLALLKALLEESEELEKTLKEIEDGKGWVQ